LIDLPLFQVARRLNSLKSYENEIHNEPCHINLYMNMGIYNWHIRSSNSTKMGYLNLFIFDTLLLNSIPNKLFFESDMITLTYVYDEYETSNSSWHI